MKTEGVMYLGTKEARTKAVMKALELGPSWSTIGTSPITKEAATEATEQYNRWVQTWIIPDLLLLLKEA